MPIRTPALTGCTTTTTGTGDYSLGPSLPAPFRALNIVLLDGDQVDYTCRDSAQFEEGVGTFHLGTNTLTRTTITSTSVVGSTAPINWAAGTRNLFITWPSSGVALTANNFSDMANLATCRTVLGVEPAFVSGTSIIFCQPSAPAGYAQDTTINDKVLRIVSGGSGGGTGGNWAITGCTVGGHQLTLAESANHTHELYYLASQLGSPGGTSYTVIGIQTTNPGGSPPAAVHPAVGTAGGDQTHTHPFTADGSWRPAYRDVIAAKKI